MPPSSLEPTDGSLEPVVEALAQLYTGDLAADLDTAAFAALEATVGDPFPGAVPGPDPIARGFDQVWQELHTRGGPASSLRSTADGANLPQVRAAGPQDAGTDRQPQAKNDHRR